MIYIECDSKFYFRENILWMLKMCAVLVDEGGMAAYLFLKYGATTKQVNYSRHNSVDCCNAKLRFYFSGCDGGDAGNLHRLWIIML